MTLLSPMPKVSGVYGIAAPSGNLYVGSSKNIRTRIKQHYAMLARSNHHSDALQAAYNKYGDNLSPFVLEECAVSDLIAVEQKYIDALKPRYNQSPIAGRIEHTEEMRLKKSKALSGMPKSAEHRAKLSLSKTGVPASAEARAKMSKTRLGVKFHTEESRAKIGAVHRGKIVSDETRAKLSAAARRRLASDGVAI